MDQTVKALQEADTILEVKDLSDVERQPVEER